jgi:hypothetical protein
MEPVIRGDLNGVLKEQENESKWIAGNLESFKAFLTSPGTETFSLCGGNQPKNFSDIYFVPSRPDVALPEGTTIRIRQDNDGQNLLIVKSSPPLTTEKGTPWLERENIVIPLPRHGRQSVNLQAVIKKHSHLLDPAIVAAAKEGALAPAGTIHTQRITRTLFDGQQKVGVVDLDICMASGKDKYMFSMEIEWPPGSQGPALDKIARELSQQGFKPETRTKHEILFENAQTEYIFPQPAPRLA